MEEQVVVVAMGLGVDMVIIVIHLVEEVVVEALEEMVVVEALVETEE
jgi:hypothetical protein